MTNKERLAKLDGGQLDAMWNFLKLRKQCECTKQDVQPVKRGTWENTNTPNQLRCSNCEIIHFIAQYPHGEINYCPNCGARMDGDSL